jgi:hypothetical protein
MYRHVQFPKNLWILRLFVAITQDSHIERIEMQRLIALCLAGLLIASAAFAEDFWTSKEYMQWTDEEVKKVMTNSPWAKDLTISVPLSALGRGGRPADNAAPNDVQSGGGGGRGRRGGGGGGGDEGGGSPEAMVTLNISFRSALPFRKALVRSRLGNGATVPADAAQLITKEPEEYVVVVTGLPARMAALLDPALKDKSILHAGKKQAMTAIKMDVQRRTQSVDVFYTFPKSPVISADDKEVELDLQIGPIHAKKKFNLKDMVYNGKLEL